MKYRLNTPTIHDANSVFQSPEFVRALFYGGPVICPHCQTGNQEGGQWGRCYKCQKELPKKENAPPKKTSTA